MSPLRPLLLILDLYRYVLCIVVFLGWLNSMSYYMSYNVTPPKIPTTHTVLVKFLQAAGPELIEEVQPDSHLFPPLQSYPPLLLLLLLLHV